jgi:hypothetical protein
MAGNSCIASAAGGIRPPRWYSYGAENLLLILRRPRMVRAIEWLPKSDRLVNDYLLGLIAAMLKRDGKAR